MSEMPQRDIINVFVGYDAREAGAYHVCMQSILDTARHPDRLAFHAVTGPQRDGTNQFIYARFLVPWRMSWGALGTHAIWLDGDMVLRQPIEDLWDLRRHDVGVQVVQHQYRTRQPRKYLGTPLEADNDDYPCKNWSSVIIWNCPFYPNRMLTPDFVAARDGAYLHRFKWLDPIKVGALPEKWNHLVGEQHYSSDAHLIHWTLGVPGFETYSKDEYAHLWHDAYSRMVNLEGERPLDVAIRAERERRLKGRA